MPWKIAESYLGSFPLEVGKSFEKTVFVGGTETTVPFRDSCVEMIKDNFENKCLVSKKNVFGSTFKDAQKV